MFANFILTQCPECGSFDVEFFTSGWFCHSCNMRITEENYEKWLRT